MIDLREKVHPDHEKPFLEHLEDLRKMIMRIVITLVISMVVCFSFQEKLMHLLRLPVEEVYTLQIKNKLPGDEEGIVRELSVEDWKRTRRLAAAMSGLSSDERGTFLASLENDEIRFHVRAFTLLRAATVLPADQRANFLARSGADADLVKQVGALLKTNPGTETNERGNLAMMSALKPTETFMLSMKLSFFAGIVLAFPFLLGFILQFILPGLHATERRVLWPAMAIGFGLFLIGAAFAYFFVLERALLFFAGWGGGLGISNDWRIGEYISFATSFTLLFGLSFELPVVVMVFVKLGLLTFDTMQRTRAYAIVGVVILAALLTPTPDIPTLLAMAVPMLLLYEICIWLAYFERKKQREAERLAREEEERRMWETYQPDHRHLPDAATADDAPDSSHGADGWTNDYSPPDPPEELPETGELPSHDKP
ncbi:MAG: twin-arginine translocase subunit TatC [Verrucomicrobiota bacterium]